MTDARRDADRGASMHNYRPVALIGRAADSKSARWGFESLLACQCRCASVDATRGRRRPMT